MSYAPYTKVYVVSQSVQYLGYAPIASLDENSLSKTASEKYDLLLPKIIEADAWRFATKVEQLSRITAGPAYDGEFNYAFSLPSDLVTLWRLYPRQLDYRIYGNRELWANTEKIHAEYRYIPDPTYFPSSFVDYLALKIAESTAINSSILSDKFKELEFKIREAHSIALYSDNSGSPSDRRVHSKILSAVYNPGILGNKSGDYS